VSAADTIFALASGRPPAAIAIIRVSGSLAHESAARLAGSIPGTRRPTLRTILDPSTGIAIDEALILRFDAPASATGENIVEFHCHGGRAVVDAVLGALQAIEGYRLAEPGEFTRRALANGRIDLTEAEGLADLLAAETELQRRSAMARAGGALRRRLESWRDDLLALSARAELAIDHVDEGDAASDFDLRLPMKQLADDISFLVDGPRVEPLRNGIRVVAAGPPNAGKSSLINALAREEKAIVTPIPGTTRDVIEVPVAIGGIPFVLVDTAGLRESFDEVEAIGIGRAYGEVEQSDILLWLGDSDQAPDHPVAIKVGPKADLAERRTDGVDVSVSALTGQGLAELASLLVERAGKLIPSGDQLALDRRQHDLLDQARAALLRGSLLSDPVLVAEELRITRHMIDQITGRAGVEDLLDALFSRFCLGK
jgi:tRNA modification GTPase